MRTPTALLATLLIALLLGACTNPSALQRDGPLTTITLAADGSDGVGTQGVPFDEAGNAYVDSIGVAIYEGQERVMFTLVDGIYSYDPDGSEGTLVFAFDADATVALPAGTRYDFQTSGYEVDTRIAYGVTSVPVSVTTESVRLELQTMVEAATLTTRLPIDHVTAGQTIDLYLAVTSPNSHPVPTGDYTVEYVVDGTFQSDSQLGHRSTVNASPSEENFVSTATVTGWVETTEGPAWLGIEPVSFSSPYAVGAMSLDTSRPYLAFTDPSPVYVDVVTTLSGDAWDEGGSIAYVHVYEGPTLIGSTDSADIDQGVAEVSYSYISNIWDLDWTASQLGTHHLKAVASDSAGNQTEVRYDVEVTEAPITTITFVDGETSATTVGGGESLVLTGAATGTEFNTAHLTLHAYNPAYPETISLNDIVVENGMWRVAWTAPNTPDYYQLRRVYDDGITSISVSHDLTVQ